MTGMSPARRSRVELAGVHLINHKLVQWRRREILVVPEVGRWIVGDGVAIAGVRDKASVGIAAGYCAEARGRDHVVVALVDTNTGNVEAPIASAALSDQCDRASRRRIFYAHRRGVRSPDAKGNSLIRTARRIGNRSDAVPGVGTLGERYGRERGNE